MRKQKTKIYWLKGVLTNNWIITLTATLVGVLTALYLNQQLAERSIEQQKNIATKNILTEIESNLNVLEKSLEKRSALLETLRFLNAFVDEEGSLVAPPDSMHRFKRKYPTVVYLQDSFALGDGLIKYAGEVNLNLNVTHLQLTTIAIETLKNSGITASYDFECLMFLEKMDKLTSEVLKKDEAQWEYVRGLRSMGGQNQELLDHIQSLINFEKSLIDFYKAGKLQLKNCN
jgi:hypothetical protein